MHQRQPGALAAHLVFLSAAAIYAVARPTVPLHFAVDPAAAWPASEPQPIVCAPRDATDASYLHRLTRVIVRTEGAPVDLGETGCEP